MFRKLLLVLIAVTDLKFCSRLHSMRALLELLKLSLQMGYTMAARLGSGTDWSVRTLGLATSVLYKQVGSLF
ncbi:hypothetical protein EDB83DRAFT_2383948 [Lactarius deliciosus]|nr:hypothetical protein EDB83DRAFT_2383948 [Lactarius deliciosus]